VLVVSAVLLVAATWSALSVVGRPFPSLLVDPWADYSVVYLPRWHGLPKDVRAADRLLRIDGVPVVRPANGFPAEELDLAARAERPLHLEFQHGDTLVSWKGAPLRFVASDVWWLFGLYALLGTLFLWAGWLTLTSGVRRAAGWAFALVSIDAFLFLTTFFDYHSRRALSPVFATASFWLLPSLLLLATVFPRPPRWSPSLQRVVTALFGALFAAGLVSGLCTALAIDWRPLRLFLNALLVPMLLSLAVAVLGRVRSADPAVRREVRASVWGLVVTPVVMAGLVLQSVTTDAVWLHLLLPLTGLFVPASVGLAVLRADVFATGAIVHRRQIAFPVVVVGLVVAGSIAALLERPWGEAWLLGLPWGVLVSVTVWVVANRLLFPSRVSFRPLMEALTARLTTFTAADDICREVEARLREALPGREVTAVLGPRLPDADFAWQQPLAHGAGSLGAVCVGHRADRGLLTQSDLTLLEVVSSVTALALTSLEARTALEHRRQLEGEASRADKRLSVDTFAAEVAHELAYPLTYFRHFLRRLQEDHRLPEDDLSIGREEVERLDRMVTLVRKFQTGPPRRETVLLLQVARRAAALLEQTVAREEQTLHLEVDERLAVLGDPDLLLQLLANLLRNGSQAAGRGGALGLQVLRAEHGRLQLVVWDSGPGFSDEVRRQLFTPLFSTRADGSGLGLTICFRIVRSLGWSIDAQREGARTCFLISGVEETS
jgi:signal transduction histidine kinase